MTSNFSKRLRKKKTKQQERGKEIKRLKVKAKYKV